MTDGAQQALRQTMEIYSHTTRFALACNNTEEIIEPIQSQCAMLRYGKLTDAQVLAKVLEVCEKENVIKILQMKMKCKPLHSLTLAHPRCLLLCRNA